MNISISQYNTVVSGLRQQLELQRDLHREWDVRFHQVVDTSVQLSKEKAAMQEAIKVMSIQCRDLREDVALAELTCSGNEGDWVPKTESGIRLQDAIGDLRNCYLDLATKRKAKKGPKG